jgi:hypothetical protein
MAYDAPSTDFSAVNNQANYRTQVTHSATGITFPVVLPPGQTVGDGNNATEAQADSVMQDLLDLLDGSAAFTATPVQKSWTQGWGQQATPTP